MDHLEVGQYWNKNAMIWAPLARQGYDVYRDYLNTPAFLEMLPAVEGLEGIDIGCGEGHNTRLVARRGAKMKAIDIAPIFVDYARQAEIDDPLGIEFLAASALKIPFPDGRFDFAVAFMSLMDIPEIEQAVAEAHRVIKPGGFFQFSICHPCFMTRHFRNLRGGDGRTYAFELGGYFQRMEGEIEEWIFSAAPEHLRQTLPHFRIPRFSRTMSEWVNLLLDAGFMIERMGEPCPSDPVVAQHPSLQDAQVMPYYLHIRARKA